MHLTLQGSKITALPKQKLFHRPSYPDGVLGCDVLDLSWEYSTPGCIQQEEDYAENYILLEFVSENRNRNKKKNLPCIDDTYLTYTRQRHSRTMIYMGWICNKSRQGIPNALC